MSKHRRAAIDPTAERVRMNLELLTKLALAVAANEQAQRRYRNAVLIGLSRVETMVTKILGGQIVESQGWKPSDADKAAKHAKEAEEWISEKSEKLGLKMIRYIYGDTETPERRHDRRRKWSGWEI